MAAETFTAWAAPKHDMAIWTATSPLWLLAQKMLSDHRQTRKAAEVFLSAYGWQKLEYADPQGPQWYKSFKIVVL